MERIHGDFFVALAINLIAVVLYAQEKPPLEEQPDRAPVGIDDDVEASR